MKTELLHVGVIETNCYIVWNEASKEGFVVDPGGNADRILDAVRQNGVSLKAVLLTHGHFDHILGVQDICDELNIPVYASADEDELLRNPEMNCTVRILRRGVTVEADSLLKADDVFEIAGFSIKCLSTPGHTRGSVCYHISSENVLFSGDTLFLESMGRTDLPTGNAHLLYESLARLLSELPDETVVYPGHGPETSIGYEKRNNPYRFRG